MAAKIRMHFHVPGPAPAPHMISGEPDGAIPLAQALREKIGHQGQGFRIACNHKLQTGEVHRATGEPWALLEVINNQVAINPDWACQDCLASKEWKEAYEAWKLENDGRPHPHVAIPEQRFNGGCC